ncbi:hypothetical protein BS47DRAFT_174354 [Hydnum rufescens UP504]|uniref:Uncharacterized protein n=1 Tax=Hydnum rufescens UP504 TaxID=1448309 RepID=A0A9P6DS67_9AGAM|nr:hypothetical protein BS47DRAFT_174354 [Hydnum rufescens UP504]
MSHEHDSRKASTNLTAAEHLALEIERRTSAVPRPSSSLLPPEVRESLESEGYPSWLPRRPHPPGPASPSHTDGDGRVAGDIRTSAENSSSGSPEQFATMQTTSSGWQAPKHGRNPTPRSVRILAVPDDHSDPAGLVARSSGLAVVPSVGQDVTVPPTVSRGPGTRFPRPEGHPRPRFRENGFHPKILRSPSRLHRAHFFLQPLLVFGHVPIQAFFDFNAAYILLQAARHPAPETPGIPVSGRGWALAYAAYLACYFVYFFSVFIGYELVYSFYRRWRAKRPLILPIYLSARASELVSMTSYTNFCFLLHLRTSAFRRSQNGSLRDGFAETCFRYSQNLPTVILLLPRAALCLAALLSFSAATPAAIQATAGPSLRDRTFFNANGSLTSYARGILITNAAWTMWRVFVLLASWLGLWILSGQGCAGLCGPRYRWEEEDDEKSHSAYSRSREDGIIDRWAWLPYTIARVQDTYDFCLTARAKRPSLTGSTRSRALPAITEAPSASLPTSGSGTARPSATPSAEALRSRAAQGTLSVERTTLDPSIPIAGSSLSSTGRMSLTPILMQALAPQL